MANPKREEGNAETPLEEEDERRDSSSKLLRGPDVQTAFQGRLHGEATVRAFCRNDHFVHFSF